MRETMNPDIPTDSRLRIEELLRIPDKERTAVEWDELAALEHAFARGNRIDTPKSIDTGPSNPRNTRNTSAKVPSLRRAGRRDHRSGR